MMTMKPSPHRHLYAAASPAWQRALRRAVAGLLRGASRVLAQAARQVAVPSAAGASTARLPNTLEFYADAGAPEGALYLDGELAAHLPGVMRL